MRAERLTVERIRGRQCSNRPLQGLQFSLNSIKLNSRLELSTYTSVAEGTGWRESSSPFLFDELPCFILPFLLRLFIMYSSRSPLRLVPDACRETIEIPEEALAKRKMLPT